MPALISPLEELIQSHVYLTKSIRGPGNFKITQINNKYHIALANDQDSLNITWRNIPKKTQCYLDNIKTTDNGFTLEIVTEQQNKQTRRIEIYIHRKNNTLPQNATYQEISHSTYNVRWIEFYQK